MSKSGIKPQKSKLTTPADASRVQAAVAHTHGGVVPAGSYVGKLQRAAAKNARKSDDSNK